MSSDSVEEPKKTARAAKAASVPDSGATSVEAVVDSDLAKQAEAVRERVAKASAEKVVPHLRIDERERNGRVARANVPREDLGTWVAPADRQDPVDILVAQEDSRVKELVPVRHARMATSAFAFYRGGAAVMAADLAVTPRTGLKAQLCGDAHLSNFGLFAAPDRSVVFDVNDFDETHPGPFEWDVKRLATSFVLAARDNGIADSIGLEAAMGSAAAYRESMADFAQRRELDIWYDRINVDELLNSLSNSLLEGEGKKGADAKVKAKAQAAITQAVAKARLRDAWSAIAKITEVVDGQRQFLSQPPLLTRLDLGQELRATINSLFREYRATLQDDRQELLKRYEIIDMGHKVVGVGSVGLLAFVILLRGRDDDDLMVLQVKQAQASVLEKYTHKSTFNKHGHRVVTGQRLMQAASDSFLGWIDGPGGRSFYIRQLRDMKWSPDPASLDEKRLRRYARLCGHTLARAHARSGDAIALSAYMGTGKSFDKAIGAFSMAYADQVALDFAAFTSAIADGRLDSHETMDGAEGTTAAQHIAAATKQARATRKKG